MHVNSKPKARVLDHKGFSLFSLGLAPWVGGGHEFGSHCYRYEYNQTRCKATYKCYSNILWGPNVCRGLSIRKRVVNLWCQTSVGSEES